MSRLARLGLVVLAAWVAAAEVRALDEVARVCLPGPDERALAAEDALREAAGLAPRFAVAHAVMIRPSTDGTWADEGTDARLWRLRIHSPGARSLNLGFTAYYMPAGGDLRVRAARGELEVGPFTAADNEQHGQLWTPVVPTDDIVVEVRVPRAEQDDLLLELTAINVGYRGFEASLERSGTCNVDVVCPEADPWQAQVRSVGVISIEGQLYCSGFLVNNTAQDKKPYFITANHCGVTTGNAASLVVYWNYQSPTCGEQGGGSLSQYQTGSVLRAAYSVTDFTLVELDDAPAPEFDVVFAGWDRAEDPPSSAVAIHHPSCDEKSISFVYQACPTTSYLGLGSPGDGTHIRVIDWDLGTTEPGSSGSPLFNQDGRVVGQLHGGYAACGNDQSDWYGRFARSWWGGTTDGTQLRTWLDPLNLGVLTLDALANDEPTGVYVTPASGLDAGGHVGGPFLPGSCTYTLENVGDTEFEYSVTATQAWLTVVGGSGVLAPQATAEVTVVVNAAADLLSEGVYYDTLRFTNLTAHAGDTTRSAVLYVGRPHPVLRWDMSTDPGWLAEGLWVWGVPLGEGGQYGHPDPSSGQTGHNVYGYNLAGDYENELPERRLTTTVLNCSGLSQVSLRFWRWLNVEQPFFDRARVRLSVDGVHWLVLWENSAEVTDAAWTYQQFDLSAQADNQPTVYLQWTMGPTDSAGQYSGWNLDDVEIWAIPACAVPVVIVPPVAAVRTVGQSVSFQLTAGGLAPLVYQWRRDGEDIAGATAPRCAIAAVSLSDAGAYDCVIANACGEVTSAAVALTVWAAGDLDCDGHVNFADINPFVRAIQGRAFYESTYPDCRYENADMDSDGSVSLGDVTEFVRILSGR